MSLQEENDVFRAWIAVEAEERGIPLDFVWNRLNSGWSLEEALTPLDDDDDADDEMPEELRGGLSVTDTDVPLQTYFAIDALHHTLAYDSNLEALSQQVRDEEGKDACAAHEDYVHEIGRRQSQRILVSALRGVEKLVDGAPAAAWLQVAENLMHVAHALGVKDYTFRERRRAAHHAAIARAAWVSILAHR